MFHGSVPSSERGALIERFREDPRCRVFLSTDAGGVGLNLQRAADDPWAAVLEAGAQWLSRLAAAAALPAEGEAAPSEQYQGLEIDPGTGRRYLRLPVPDPRALAKLADALSALLASANERTGQRRNPVATLRLRYTMWHVYQSP